MFYLVDGGFTDWSSYGDCSATCGGGSQKSVRSCTNPAPAHGGDDCDGDSERTRNCNEQPCPGIGRKFFNLSHTSDSIKK